LNYGPHRVTLAVNTVRLKVKGQGHLIAASVCVLVGIVIPEQNYIEKMFGA